MATETYNGNHLSLNLNVRGMGKSATVAINEMSNRMLKQGQKVFKLGLGQSPFPVPACVVEALRHNAHQKNYLEVQGLRPLREVISTFHQKNEGISIMPENIMVGPGSKELMFLLQLAYYGDLITASPSWVSYAPQARIIGKKVIFVQTTFEEKWRITPDRLEEICSVDPTRPRLVILNYPGNPDGLTYRPQELMHLGEIGRKYNLIFLSDEIYGKINHTGCHQSVARFYPEGTIISSGLSKWCGAGGWRLGTFAFPPSLAALKETMTSLASETYTSTSAPIQYAAIRAFQGGQEIEVYLAHVRRVLAGLGMWCAHRLRDAGTLVHDPQGAFYLFIDFLPLKPLLGGRGIETGKALCEIILEETGVAVLPGVDFGRPENEYTARLAYVDFDGASALTASQHIPLDEPLTETFYRAQCFKVLEAIDRLCQWIDDLVAGQK